jgi:hypothetical protein
MKKSLLFLLVICFIFANQASAQSSLNKLTGSVKNELTGNSKSNSSSTQEPEPLCACEQPEFIVALGGKLKIDYKELSILTMDDGSFLLRDGAFDKFYIVNGGVSQGPFDKENPRIAGFENFDLNSSDQNDQLGRYKGILSKSGEKTLITMGGKTYGPYIDIQNFTVSRSGDKFAVVAYVPDKDFEGGVPKFVTNIPNVTFDMVNTLGAYMCGSIKYDEILVVTEDKIINLQGKTLFTIEPEMSNCDNLFINTSTTKYAYYDFGTLTFSDKTSLPDTFNPHLVKVGGTVNLAYMYYSPKRNAIMQCKISF